MRLCTEDPDKSTGSFDIRKDPDDLFAPPEFRNEAFEHIRRLESLVVLSWQAEHGRGVDETLFQNFKGRGRLLSDLLSKRIEALQGLLLRVGL